jgi:hypothetical protein
MSSPVPGLAPGKYARIERERRFLLVGLPAGEQPAAARKIIDHYLAGTTLRLRCVRRPGGDQYKLTQKIPAPQPGPVQGLITNIYLSEAEYNQLVAALPGPAPRQDPLQHPAARHRRLRPAAARPGHR